MIIRRMNDDSGSSGGIRASRRNKNPSKAMKKLAKSKEPDFIKAKIIKDFNGTGFS